MTDFPDELIEACVAALADGYGPNSKVHAVLTTARDLGYATEVPWREAAARELYKRGHYHSALYLRSQADTAPPAPVEPSNNCEDGYHNVVGGVCRNCGLLPPRQATPAPTVEPRSLRPDESECLDRALRNSTKTIHKATPPAEAVTRGEFETLGQAVRCIQSVLCEMDGDCYVLWTVANEYLDDLGIRGPAAVSADGSDDDGGLDREMRMEPSTQALMTDPTLQEQAREHASQHERHGHDLYAELCTKCANRIDELEAENERLRVALTEVCAQIFGVGLSK